MDSTGDPVRTETVIVGAGQAGLAVGYELARRGRSSVILDAHERIGDSWRMRWDSLGCSHRPGTTACPAGASRLRGGPIPPRTRWPTTWRRTRRGSTWTSAPGCGSRRCPATDGRFVVSAPDGRYAADQVVVATGGYQAPRIPPFASGLTQGTHQLHSSELPEPVAAAGRSCAWWSERATPAPRSRSRSRPATSTWLSGRDTGQEPVRPGSWSDRLATPPFWFVLSHVLTVGNPLGRKVRRDLSRRGLPLARVRRADLAAAGVERVPRVTGVEGGRPVLEDGRALDPATVIWCTGFTADYAWIDLPVLDAEGQPMHDRGVVASAPGLYFMGLFFQHAGTSSLVGGAGRDAAHVAAHIVGRRRTERLGAARRSSSSLGSAHGRPRQPASRRAGGHRAVRGRRLPAPSSTRPSRRWTARAAGSACPAPPSTRSAAASPGTSAPSRPRPAPWP